MVSYAITSLRRPSNWSTTSPTPPTALTFDAGGIRTLYIVTNPETRSYPAAFFVGEGRSLPKNRALPGF
jgi:hypothetical protein